MRRRAESCDMETRQATVAMVDDVGASEESKSVEEAEGASCEGEHEVTEETGHVTW